MHVETVIVGAGQAGLALSRQLAIAGRPHVVLERGRVAERWRSQRWDSLRLLTPNWLSALPGTGAHPDPDGFLDRDGVVAYLEAYARRAPVRERTAVRDVRRAGDGYRVRADGGDWSARNVVIATGDCDLPHVTASAADAPASVHQLHSSAYRRPASLPAGGVLVVGAGPSGQQIAAELRRAGREVVLAVGRHARMARRYRGRDIFWWLDAMGRLDEHADDVPDLAAARRTPGFAISGAAGGESLGLDRLAALGVVVTGRLAGFSGGEALLAGDLARQLHDADRMRRVLDGIDAFAERERIPVPPADRPPPVVLGPGPRRLALGGRISTVLWATGYARAYPWLAVPVLDACGELVHREGVTAAPGLFALGLRLQRTRRSHLLGGVGGDAARIAAAIAARGAGAELERGA